MTLLPSSVTAMGMPALWASRSRLAVQAEAVDFHARQDDRALGGGDPPRGLADGLASASGVARRLLPRGLVRALGHDADHIARQLDIARPPERKAACEHAIDLLQGCLRVVQFGVGAADAAEDLGLGAKVLHVVVQQGIVERSLRPGEPLMTTTGDFSA